jgi:hypothetical protein
MSLPRSDADIERQGEPSSKAAVAAATYQRKENIHEHAQVQNNAAINSQVNGTHRLVNVFRASLLQLANNLLCSRIDSGKSLARDSINKFVVDE